MDREEGYDTTGTDFSRGPRQPYVWRERMEFHRFQKNGADQNHHSFIPPMSRKSGKFTVVDIFIACGAGPEPLASLG